MPLVPHIPAPPGSTGIRQHLSAKEPSATETVPPKISGNFSKPSSRINLSRFFEKINVRSKCHDLSKHSVKTFTHVFGKKADYPNAIMLKQCIFVSSLAV